MDPVIKAILDMMESDAQRYTKWAEESDKTGAHICARTYKAQAEALRDEITSITRALSFNEAVNEYAKND